MPRSSVMVRRRIADACRRRVAAAARLSKQHQREVPCASHRGVNVHAPFPPETMHFCGRCSRRWFGERLTRVDKKRQWDKEEPSTICGLFGR